MASLVKISRGRAIVNIILLVCAFFILIAAWQSHRDQQEILALMRVNPAFFKDSRSNPQRQPIVASQLDLKGTPQMGSARTNVVLVELSDYQCPFCQRFFSETLPRIQEQYVSSGRIRYAFMDLPNEKIHAVAVDAAEATRCALEQGRYWEMHAKLFERHVTSMAEIIAASTAVSLKQDDFDKCFNSHTYVPSILNTRDALRESGFIATPSFVIGIQSGSIVSIKKTLVGARPFSAFEKEIDEVLKTSDVVQ